MSSAASLAPARGRTPPVLTQTEVLSNLPLGPDITAGPLPTYRGGTLTESLDEVILSALRRPPCVVSFSGGRDSSAVLAVAVDVARRQGLPEPIPVIMRHPNDPDSDETEWQELVLRHLRLDNAEILTVTAELDALGPLATEMLAREGLLWPANAFAHLPVIDIARGGTMLTGIGGDELLAPQPRLTRRHRLFLTAPRRVREAWLWSTLPFSGFEWLRPQGRAMVRRAYARDEADEAVGWERTIRRWYRSRYFSAMATGLPLVARGHDVTVVNPFIEETVLVQLVHLAGHDGFSSRAEATGRLFGHLLPEAVITRRTKATFGGELWGEATRRFATEWSGDGLDRTIVDAARLRRELLADEPDFRTVLLLHQAWLHDHRSSRASS
jgi:Asparagine synthase